ncbi:MAG: hypothetical protein NUW22_04950 [Acidobacteria bacterium]|nr:hypothetical protein [Acidobacteriota bacterium]
MTVVFAQVFAPVMSPCWQYAWSDWEFWFYSCWMFNYDLAIGLVMAGMVGASLWAARGGSKAA